MNVGCGDRISVLDLVHLINGLAGRRIEPVFTAARPGDVRDSQASISKAERLLGYRPLVPVRDGLAATVRWFADVPDPTEGVAAR
jgi:nucleoside-diphosphate-sugar epimerase